MSQERRAALKVRRRAGRPISGGLPSRRASLPAQLAAALAFASAAVTLFWTLGGTFLLDTVGGQFVELARDRSAAALLLGSVVVFAKVAAGVLALSLVHPRLGRSRRRLLGTVSAGGGALLALYGGVLVAVGALVLAGTITPAEEVDIYALRWHVLFWDLWFVIWGLALAVAGVRARRRLPRGAA